MLGRKRTIALGDKFEEFSYSEPQKGPRCDSTALSPGSLSPHWRRGTGMKPKVPPYIVERCRQFRRHPIATEEGLWQRFRRISMRCSREFSRPLSPLVTCPTPFARGAPMGSGLGENANEDSVKLLIVNSKTGSVHRGTTDFLLDRE